MLVRSPFFKNLIGERWNTEDRRLFELDLSYDVNMSKEAFELTLKYIYGKELTSEEAEDHLFGLLALGSYFDLPKLVYFVTTEIVDGIGEKELGPIALFCYDYDYGSNTEKIWDECFKYMEENLYCKCCKDREIRMEQFVDYPVRLMTRALSSDQLYVPTEWTRCLLFVAYYEATIQSNNGCNGKTSIRTDEVSGKLETIQEALNNGVYFCNIEFGQLRRIMMTKKNVDGKPLIYEDTAMKHLWMSAEFKHCIENADREEAGLLSSEPEHIYNVPNTFERTSSPLEVFNRVYHRRI
ncbi:hypothetical protein TRICI_002032 [Trichomonascus ciferrii]|uniref:BTB domain-containing protein n=1 Tax=Trichomonascus ciferrii TaxID=44093 RepID=A0A642V6W6_9ASCO|nr:hypothetical protein TRICI_002032 [Trichomonascus ciferrii]